MTYAVSFLVCLIASCIGPICGVGGGSIIKPVMDAFGIFDVATVSFLSGCTVFAMAGCTFVKNKVSRQTLVRQRTSLPLAIGAVGGGIIGKWIFGALNASFDNSDKLVAIQSICLIIVTAAALCYTLFKSHVKTMYVQSVYACVGIGLVLGVVSSFLGISGGQINLVILLFLFSMTMKEAAENSVYIILFSQGAGILFCIFTGQVPNFPVSLLVLMVLGGLIGGFIGGTLAKRVSSEKAGNLFVVLMGVIVGISFCNLISTSIT